MFEPSEFRVLVKHERIVRAKDRGEAEELVGAEFPDADTVEAVEEWLADEEHDE